MAYDIEGRLYKKMDTVQLTDTFRKREFVLEVEDGAYTQLIKLQLTQNNCEKMEPFEEGDMLKIAFSLKGREYTKNGSTMYFTNLEAWRVDKLDTGTVSQAPPTASGEGAFPAATDEPTGGSSIPDDLPF